MVKACRADGSFESTARALIDYTTVAFIFVKGPDHGLVQGTQLRESMGNHHKRGNPHHLNLDRDTVSIDLPTWLTPKAKIRSGTNPRIGMRMMAMNQTSMTMNDLMVLMKRKQ